MSTSSLSDFSSAADEGYASSAASASSRVLDGLKGHLRARSFGFLASEASPSPSRRPEVRQAARKQPSNWFVRKARYFAPGLFSTFLAVLGIDASLCGADELVPAPLTQTKLAPGQIEFSPLPDSVFRSALERTGKLLAVEERNPIGARRMRSEKSPLNVAPTPEPKAPAEWIRTLTTAEADLVVNLHFVYKGDPLYEGPEQPFDMMVKIDPAKALVKHSQVRLAQHLGGIQSSFLQTGFSRIYLEGRGKTSIFLLVPDYYVGGVRTIFLCPRTVSAGVGFIDSQYRVVSADFTATALADATFAASSGKSTVRTTIVTSPMLRPPEKFLNEVTLEGALTSRLEYSTAAFGETVGPYMVAMKRGRPRLIGGIAAGVGYETAQQSPYAVQVSSVLQIQEMELPFQVKIGFKGENATVLQGLCYAIGKKSWLGAPNEIEKDLATPPTPIPKRVVPTPVEEPMDAEVVNESETGGE